MNISIHFNGWFEARFATDPDPFDHPRGNDGWTFAVEGEPDFDRVIRFHNPVAVRSRGPAAGVYVREVVKDAQVITGHPLVGAPVELLDDAKFEGHNGLIAGAGREPVFPLHLRIAAGQLVIETTEWLTFADLTRPAGVRRKGLGVTSVDPALLQSLLGGLGPAAFREQRKADLTNDLAGATGATRRALEQRIALIDPATDNIRTNSLTFRVPYSLKVPVANRVFADPQNQFGTGSPSTLKNWTWEWWMGVWDADALCGYIEGALKMTP